MERQDLVHFAAPRQDHRTNRRDRVIELVLVFRARERLGPLLQRINHVRCEGFEDLADMRRGVLEEVAQCLFAVLLVVIVRPPRQQPAPNDARLRLVLDPATQPGFGIGPARVDW